MTLDLETAGGLYAYLPEIPMNNDDEYEKKAIHYFNIRLRGILALIVSIIITIQFFISFWNAVGFVISLIALRLFAGGYHAKKEWLCYLYSFIMIFSSCAFTEFMSRYYFLYFYSYIIVNIVLLFFSVPVILLLAPVDSESRSLSEREKGIFQGRIRLILLIICILVLISGFRSAFEAGTVMLMAMLWTAIGLIIGDFKK